MTQAELEQAAQAARWYADLQESTVPSFFPLYFDEHRFLVLKGGGGSGKSIFAGRKVLERCLTEPGHRMLVCRKVGRTLRQSCFEQLRGQLAEHYPNADWEANRGDLSIRFGNGSAILMSGLDDVEKLKSIYHITGIWIEEASELLEADLNQLDIRMRDETPYYKQMILSFNPISITHWLKRRFFDSSDPFGRVRTHESTYLDNPFLSQEARQTLEAFRDQDEYFYQVYALGMWGVTGNSVFDAKAVSRRLQEAPQPVAVGYFTYTEGATGLGNIQWVEDPNGFIRIYQPPEAGAPYVLGGDTAGEGSDRFVGQVLDNRTGEQVATLRHQFDEDVYAKQCYCLGMHYNTALIGIECNYSTYPVLELERLRYPKQYVRESVDDFTHKVRRSFGFMTTGKTRPVILAGLIQTVREDVNIVSDRDTLEEMLTFVRNEDWRPEAEQGAHDDCVMALAIAHYIRGQQRYTLEKEAGAGVSWSKSQWEDYDRASPAEREMMVQMWGEPRR